MTSWLTVLGECMFCVVCGAIPIGLVYIAGRMIFGDPFDWEIE
jgi:hypothetical protein